MRTPLLLLLLLLLSSASGIWHTTFCVLTGPRPVSYLAQVEAALVQQGIMRSDGVGMMRVDAGHNNKRCDDDDPGEEGVPSCRVRQRSLDVILALGRCANHTSGWVVLVEDDCVACEGAVDEVLRALSTLNTSRVSLALFSKFLRGAAFPRAKVDAFGHYVRGRERTHPHDITRIEDWDPLGATLYRHDRNLFHHIGHMSTETHKNRPEFRQRYRDLREDVCWEPL